MHQGFRTKRTRRILASQRFVPEALESRTLLAAQAPFDGTPFNVNEVIQAEDFDLGGQGTAYSDTEAANKGGKHRPGEGVDIEASGDTGGGFNVGYARPGEWLEYTFTVAAAGNYDIQTRLGAVQNGQLHYEVDGVRKATVAITPTAGFQAYKTLTHSLGNLTAGTHVLRLAFDSTSGDRGVANVNWLKIVPADGGGGGGGGQGLTGTYFDNENFTNPKFTRVDPNINFDWGQGSPDSRIAPDTFSVRWTGQIDIPQSGTYTFTARADDRARVLIDGQQVLNYVPGSSSNTGTVTLTAGRHDFVYEYVERTGNARARLDWSGPGISGTQTVPASRFFTDSGTPGDTQAPSSVPNAEHYEIDTPGAFVSTLFWDAASDNTGVTGYRIYRDGVLMDTVGADVREYSVPRQQHLPMPTFAIAAIDAAGNQGPVTAFTFIEEDTQQPLLVPNFAVEELSRPGVTEYRASWTAAHDDTGIAGYRLRISEFGDFNDDGQFETRERTEELPAYARTWSLGVPSSTTVNLQIAAVDTAGRVGPFVSPQDSPKTVLPHGLRGNYYDNDDFTRRAHVRTDRTVNFDWGQGSPDSSIGSDTFSAQWSGLISLDTPGTYTFWVPADDRAKLIINGQTVVDYIPGQTSNSGQFNVTHPARYAVSLEYREFTGNARVSLQWQTPENGPAPTRRVVASEYLWSEAG